MSTEQLAPGDLTELERMIDRTSLRAVLIALRNIADEKADHIAVNWGGYSAHDAQLWNKAAVQIGNCADRPSIVKVSEGR